MDAKERKEREERLKRICANINKEVEKADAVTYLGSGDSISIERFPTGSPELDRALGGGWPRGRFVELMGPESGGKTTICLHGVAEFQKHLPNEDVALVDTEHSFDPVYAKAIGVDTDLLLVNQPESGEEALNVVRKLVHNNVGLIIVDSVAALVPQAELDGDIGDAHVAQQARLMSQAMRMLCAEAGSRKVTIFWTNQMRDKIGVCFEYHVPVLLEDGTTEWIGKIVNQKLPVRVMSYDPNTGLLVPKKIRQWVHNGTLPKGEQFVRIHVAGVPGASRGGQRGITATKSHRIFTPSGERPAGDIKVGDEVLVNDWQYFTPEHHEFILGSILGDAGIRYEKGSPRGHIRFKHGPKQAEYCAWKAFCFGVPLHVGKGGEAWFVTPPTQELEYYSGIGKKKAVRCFPHSLVGLLTPKSVAIWYQDDGTYGGSHERWGWGKCSIAAKCLSGETLQAIADHLERLGMGRATAKEGRGLEWNGSNSRLFQQAIAPFVHPSMRYKIKKGMAPFSWIIPLPVPVMRGYARKVTRVDLWTPPPRRRSLFDLEIEGHHSYVAGGIIVHNTWGDKTTTPGGRALRHYASVRVSISPIARVKDGEEIVGTKVKADVKKNKVAAPFKQAEFYISFGTGIDRVAALCDEAITLRVVKKRGAQIYVAVAGQPLSGEILGKGRLDFIEAVKKDRGLFDTLNELVKNAPPPEAEEAKEDDPEADKKNVVKKIKKPKNMGDGVMRVPVTEDNALPDGEDASGSAQVEVTDA
jgi:recombination protein RecA